MRLREVILLSLLLSGGVLGSDLKYLGTKQPYQYEKIEVRVPEGYKPFFINHLGRHGSRHLSSAKYDKSIYELLDMAEKEGKITKEGKELKKKVAEILKIENGNYGLLTEVGKKEHRDIAKRMYENNREVFGKEIRAKATYVERAQQSRDAFLEELAKYTPQINFKASTNTENDIELRFYDLSPEYLKYEDEEPWKKAYKKYAKSKNYDFSILEQFFKKDFINKLESGVIQLKSAEGKVVLKNTNDAVANLYDLYIIQSNIGKDLGIGKYFTTEELKWYEELDNIKDFYGKGPGLTNINIATEIAKPLLQDFLISSDNAIANNNISADLRFAHAETIIPFITLMEIEGMSDKQDDISKVYNTWYGSDISCMGANIQWIFYKNEAGDILVKILHNEKPVSIPVKSDMKPFYKWKDIKDFYNEKLSEIKWK
ncbi:histidine-type phosphatase [uncultured Fusobacterium sp.]|uniref:histidine-type phosphatase n=1 Tax=uncultured Fusobacterium sp. TaxID=159267 RepID=UPI0025CE2E63|nr:histidine-type phosphatase [uncultured Fusobacterium sp.]